jgi:serine/threonine protein kinase
MSQPLAADQIYDGYRLIRFLGRGGFGEVWLCQSEAVGDFRAFKWVPATGGDRLEKEYEALILYRKAVSQIRSPHLVPIEHINRNPDGLYYIMPLADGEPSGTAPSDPVWLPTSLLGKVQARCEASAWFSSSEIHAMILPLLDALQTLSDAGLVHRDVKPENILFFRGHPCLGDISLLGADTAHITRRGTPGYSTPSWYQGGLPDMYAAAATLYTLLTGNLPDKMGRSAFLWPPQGEDSLSEADRVEWQRLHAVIRRAADEKVSERFVDLRAMALAIQPGLSAAPPPQATSGRRRFLASAACAAAIGMGVTGWQIAQRKAHTKKLEERKTAESTAEEASKKEEITEKSAPDPTKPNLTPEQEADYTALATMVMGYVTDREYTLALATVEELWATYPYSRTQPAYSIARAMSLHGLGRTEEAKEEMRKEINQSPYIGTMSGVKDISATFFRADCGRSVTMAFVIRQRTRNASASPSTPGGRCSSARQSSRPKSLPTSYPAGVVAGR